MNCTSVRDRYESYMADDLSSSLAVRIEEHLALCSECCEWFDAQQAIGEALRAAADAAVPPGRYFEGLYQRIAPKLVRAERWSRTRRFVFDPFRALFFSGSGVARFARAGAICAIGLAAGAALGSVLLPMLKASPINVAGIAGSPGVTTAEISTPSFDLGIHQTALKGSTVDKSSKQPYPDSLNSNPAQMYSVTFRDRMKIEDAGAPGMADSAPAPDWASVARRLKESGVFEELWLLEDGLNLVGQKGLTGNFDRVENALADVVIYQDTIDSEAYRTYTLQTKLILEGSQVRVQGDLDGAEFRYQQAIELASDSRWACIAAYELGNVKYENRRDYDAARQYYSRCLTEYPHKYLNALQLQQVKGRLEALEMYQDIDDYRPLRMYLSASALEPAAARVEPFLELIDAYPETSLAQKAVLVLAKLSTSEETFSEIPWQNIYGHFSEYLLRAPNGPLSAHCRLAMAEMLSLRLHNYSEARLEYDKVLHMTKDPELVGRAGTQIQRLEILESGQGE